MATVITSECINCGACEPECPNTAIYQGGVEWQAPDGAMHPAISNDIFYIVPEKCTECVGFHDHEACAAVCPVDCCVPDPNIPETHDVLLARARALHPTEAIPDDAPSRFKKEGGGASVPAAKPSAEPKAAGRPAPAPVAAPAAAAPTATPPSAEAFGLVIPPPEEWEIPIRCFRCSGDYTVPFKYFRAGTVFYCPHCQGSFVPTLGVVIVGAFMPMYSSMPFAVRRPAPIARITVAAPVTMSPPAKIPGTLVIPVFSATSI